MNKVFFILLFPLNILAQQFPSDLWHPGLLVTNDGDTIKGDLKYDFENQSIQLDDGQTLKAYNVNNLFFLSVSLHHKVYHKQLNFAVQSTFLEVQYKVK